MIKYLLTEDVLFILPLKCQISREANFFEEVINICNNPESNIDQLNFLDPNLNYSSPSIEISDEGDYADIYYNGKYHTMPEKFHQTCLSLIKNRTSFTKKSLILFLEKCFKNSNYSFKELWAFFENHNFNFLDNGNILVYKEFSEDDLKKKNFFVEEKIVVIKSFNENKKYTIIEIDPSEIENGRVMNYKIRDFGDSPCLQNTYQKSFLYSTLFDIIFDNRSNISKMKETITAILNKNIDEIIYRGRLESFFKDTSEIEVNLFHNTILRLCQE